MRNLKEYLDVKGKLQKPVISIDGDTSPTPAVKPPKAVTKGKNWHAELIYDDKPTPYSASGLKKKQKVEKGLGFAGDKNLVYEPETTDGATEEYYTFPNEKISSVWQLPEGKELPLSEFLSNIKKGLMIKENNDIPTVYAPRKGEIYPDPVQAIKYTSFLGNENNKLLEMLVLEIKRVGCLKKLIELALVHKEAYDQVANELANYKEGAVNCRRLARSIKEATMPPVADDEEKLHMKKKKKKTKEPQDMVGPPEEKNMPPDTSAYNTVEHNLTMALRD